MPGPVRFLTTATSIEDAPLPDRPEVAITGRSNAGKSSLINAITGQKIAKTSQTPGKTRHLNFFAMGENYRFVDMPGYGFAARSWDERDAWQSMIEGYLRGRENLRLLLLIMDIRRQWADEEQMLLEFCQSIGLPLVVVLNKIDKSKQSERHRRQQQLKGLKGIDGVFMTSCAKRQGVRELEEAIFKGWVQ